MIHPTAIVHSGAKLGPGVSVGAYSIVGEHVEIGEVNTSREYCTLSCGTVQDTGVTRIGNDNWIMAYVHIAHDCRVGDHTVFANVATLAGHVQVGDYAVLGGFTGAHQFVSIGEHSITGVATVLLQDLPPYVMAAGNTA